VLNVVHSVQCSTQCCHGVQCGTMLPCHFVQFLSTQLLLPPVFSFHLFLVPSCTNQFILLLFMHPVPIFHPVAVLCIASAWMWTSTERPDQATSFLVVPFWPAASEINFCFGIAVFISKQLLKTMYWCSNDVCNSLNRGVLSCC